MSALGFIQNQVLPAARATSAPTATDLRFQVTAALASSQRLWIQGRLVGLAPQRPLPWWARWRRVAEPPLPTAHLETLVAGQRLEAELAVSPLGEINATFDVSLPPARRGWRIARNHITCQGATAQACSVVLGPGLGVSGITLAVLPPCDTLTARPTAAPLLVSLSGRQAASVQRLLQARADRNFLCYVAAAAGDPDERRADLALRLTAQGWPHGHLVTLPTVGPCGDLVLAQALDRFRWLFADSQQLEVIAPGPIGPLVTAALQPAPDRAMAHVRGIEEDTASHAEPTPVRRGLRPIRSGLVTRNPVVFCHGMLACSMLHMQLREDYNYFSVLRRSLEDRGFQVLFPRVLPTGGVVERAKMLAEQIQRWTQEPVNIIAHSMGGLDARYAITHLGLANQVRSLTTIATPHRGTFMADWFRANFGRRVPLLGALRALGISVEGFNDCRPSVCREFNAHTPDAPQVRYFSYAGDVPLQKVTPMLRRAWELLYAAEGPNDGLVSVASARWGEYLGSIFADHFAQTPDGLFVHPTEDFHSLTFVMSVLEGLARRGF